MCGCGCMMHVWVWVYACMCGCGCACGCACGCMCECACLCVCMRVTHFSQVDRTTTLLAKPSVLPGVVTLEKPFKITCTLKNLRYIPRCSGHVCACVSSLCQPLSVSLSPSLSLSPPQCGQDGAAVLASTATGRRCAVDGHQWHCERFERSDRVELI